MRDHIVAHSTPIHATLHSSASYQSQYARPRPPAPSCQMAEKTFSPTMAAASNKTPMQEKQSTSIRENQRHYAKEELRGANIKSYESTAFRLLIQVTNHPPKRDHPLTTPDPNHATLLLAPSAAYQRPYQNTDPPFGTKNISDSRKSPTNTPNTRNPPHNRPLPVPKRHSSWPQKRSKPRPTRLFSATSHPSPMLWVA